MLKIKVQSMQNDVHRGKTQKQRLRAKQGNGKETY